MKVTNWRSKIIASLVASGAITPAVSYAVDIPLGDPSFELYSVPTPRNYAYAVDPNGAYRPTSPWVDDIDSPPGFQQDAGSSNWIINAAYAESVATNKRPAPRTGNQVMHTLDNNFNGQELANVFEAGKTYQFSIWAQYDQLLNQPPNSVSLFLFDGNVPFTPTNSLASSVFTEFNIRAPGMTAAQSALNWSQLSITHTVSTGAPEIGHPIGVAFRGQRDSAVDDASLTVEDAATQVLVLEINTTNGQVRMRNQTGATVNVDYYEIKSTSNALNAVGWTSIQDQTVAGFPAGNGTGNGWEEAGGSSSSVLSESYLTGNSAFTNSLNVNLGAGFNVGGAQTLEFNYGKVTAATNPTGDYNNNGTVDAADYVLWRNGGPLANDPSAGVQASDYDQWRANFGNSSSAGPGRANGRLGPLRHVVQRSGCRACARADFGHPDRCWIVDAGRGQPPEIRLTSICSARHQRILSRYERTIAMIIHFRILPLLVADGIVSADLLCHSAGGDGRSRLQNGRRPCRRRSCGEPGVGNVRQPGTAWTGTARGSNRRQYADLCHD